MPSLPILRQSAAELLALVVIDLFPGALLVQSATTEFGFYCDIIAEQSIDDYALPLIEEKMRSYAKQDLEVRSLDMMREVAANYLDHKGQPFRAEAARAAKVNILTMIQIGQFCDYCSSPFITQTKEVESFKIFRVEPATHYTPEQGLLDVKRIHGAVANDKQSLKKLVKALQAGKKADHTKLPIDQNLFSMHDGISELAYVFESNGLLLKNILINWWEKEHSEQQFTLVSTPSAIKESLVLKTCTHEDPFVIANQLAFEFNDCDYVIAPSAAPAHMMLFKEKTRTSREMPVRIGEFSSLISQEKTIKHWGLIDSCLVSADYAHIFCAPEHLEEELISSLQFIDKIIKMFEFEYYWYFKGRGDKFAGSEVRWEKAVKSFDAAFEKCGFAYISADQDGAYAGPLVEARLIDSFGRDWKGPTLGLDFNGPDRLGLRYQANEGKTHVPLMICRSLFGSIERFAALLLEHTSGRLPLWIAPEQVKVMPVKAEYDGYAKKVKEALSEAGYRATIDYGNDPIGKKIARAENEKIPYQIIVGDKEVNGNLITLRTGVYEAHQQMMTVEAFLKLIHDEVLLKTPRTKLRVR